MPLHPHDTDAASVTGFMSTIAHWWFQLWWKRGQEDCKGHLQATWSLGMQYFAAEQPNEETGEGVCGKQRLLLFWTMLRPEMERKKDMRQKKKSRDDAPVTRPHGACEHIVNWNLCPHWGWNVVYSLPVISTSSHCHTNKVQQNHCNPSAEAFERFLLRHDWIRCKVCFH